MLVANILFVSCHSQTNLKSSIEFLTTRVNQPNLDNYKKLARCVRYIRDTVELPLTLEERKSRIMRRQTNAANGLHPYTKRHSGIMMSRGKGSMQSKPSNQKLSMWRSTEAEIVGADDHLSGVLCSMELLE